MATEANGPAAQPSRPSEAAIRRASRGRVARILVPVLLVLGGMACLVYGAGFHERDVLVEEEIELLPELVPPDPFGLPTGQFPGAPEVRETEIFVIPQSEPDLVREVTYGGVALAEDGVLERTYTGEAPSACPT